MQQSLGLQTAHHGQLCLLVLMQMNVHMLTYMQAMAELQKCGKTEYMRIRHEKRRSARLTAVLLEGIYVLLHVEPRVDADVLEPLFEGGELIVDEVAHLLRTAFRVATGCIAGVE